jgi:IclR family transcriptional regulator, acetate operon repressor
MDNGTTTASRALTVERAVAMLDVMRDSGVPLGVRELSRRLDVSPTAVHRLLTSLRAGGLVEQDPTTRGYSLGWGILRYADSVLRRTHLADRGAPIARRLRDLSRETVTLYVPVGDERVCVYEAESPHDVRRHVGLGTRVPLAAGSSGRAILAFLPQSEIDRVLAVPIIRFTKATILDPGRLLELLEETRRTGISLSQEETVPDVVSIAAPIFELGGRVTGSLAISGPSGRWRPETALGYAQPLRVACIQLSESLGYTGRFPSASAAEAPSMRSSAVG